ncbi:MAG: hypothetical protein ACLFQK_00390 [Fibrobacterota bacterium]
MSKRNFFRAATVFIIMAVQVFSDQAWSKPSDEQELISGIKHKAVLFSEFQQKPPKGGKTKFLRKVKGKISWMTALYRKDGTVFLSWRADTENEKYNIYRANGTKDFIKTGKTVSCSFSDNSPGDSPVYYVSSAKSAKTSDTVRPSLVIDGRDGPASVDTINKDTVFNVYKIYRGVCYFSYGALTKAWVGFFDSDDLLDFCVFDSKTSSVYLDHNDALQKKTVFMHTDSSFSWSADYIFSSSLHGQYQAIYDFNEDGTWDIASFEPSGPGEDSFFRGNFSKVKLTVRDGNTGKILSETENPILGLNSSRIDIMAADLDGEGRPDEIVVKRENYFNTLEAKVTTPLRSDENRKHRLKIFRWPSSEDEGVYGSIEKDQYELRFPEDGYYMTAKMSPQWMAFDSELSMLWRVWLNDQSAHNPCMGDLDFDGKDEIAVGGNIVLDDDGTPLWMLRPQKDFPYRKNIMTKDQRLKEYTPGSLFWAQADGMWIGDIDPEIPGPELVVSSENNLVGTGLLDRKGNLRWLDQTIMKSGNTRLSVADFIPSSPGKEIITNQRMKGSAAGGCDFTVFSSKGKILPVTENPPVFDAGKAFL